MAKPCSKIELKKIDTLNRVKKNKIDKFIKNMSFILQNEFQKRKIIIFLVFSIIAISIDIKYVSCDESAYIKKNINKDFLNTKDGSDINDFELNFEELEAADAFYFLKHNNKMYMIQYSANSPIEDRCFIYNININSKDIEKRKSSDTRGNLIEKEFVNSFEKNLMKEKNEEASGLIYEASAENEKLNSEKERKEDRKNLLNDIFENDSMCNKKSNGLDDNFLFAGVIDGHGGSVIAEVTKRTLGYYVKKQLIKKMKKDKKETLGENDIISGLEKAYLNLDNDILKNVKEFFLKDHVKYSRIGACCLTVLIDNNNYYVSNVGDSKGLLIRKNGYITLNNIHNANQVNERKKLLEEHPNEKDIVFCKKEKKPQKGEKFQMMNISDKINKLLLDNYDHCYVKGRLQPTRNIGDFYLKDKMFAYDYVKKRYIVNKPHSFPYINAKPEVLKIKKSEEDEFIILMTDGVSDFLKETEVIDIVKRNSNSVEKASKAIIQSVLKKAASEANLSMERFLNVLPEYKRRLHDDISIVLIKLNE